MKIRTSFVTNSSSSAFIVAFPKRVSTIDDVRRYISKEKADYIFYDLQKMKSKRCKKTNKSLYKKIVETIQSGFVDGMPDYIDELDTFKKKHLISNEQFMQKNYYCEFENYYNKKCEKILKPEIDKFIKDADGYYIYFLEYGDNGSILESQIEHGDTFVKLPHIRVSKH